MNQSTRDLIKKFSPMWTNKQVWEFEQTNDNLRFDLLYTDSANQSRKLWDSKLGYPDSDIRETTIRTLHYLKDGYELLIASKSQGRLEEQHIAYLMAVMADVVINEEVCLNFRIYDNCLGVSIDANADVIDCKEFFEEFYHLATGFNYDTDTGIPDDETEAEIYLTRLQEEFDERMKAKLGNAYLPGNNDPDTLNSE